MKAWSNGTAAASAEALLYRTSAARFAGSGAGRRGRAPASWSNLAPYGMTKVTEAGVTDVSPAKFVECTCTVWLPRASPL